MPISIHHVVQGKVFFFVYSYLYRGYIQLNEMGSGIGGNLWVYSI